MRAAVSKAVVVTSHLLSAREGVVSIGELAALCRTLGSLALPDAYFGHVAKLQVGYPYISA